MNLSYIYSKFFKKIIRGKSILNSKIDKTAKIYSGTEFYNSSIGRHSYVGYDSEVYNCEIGAFCSIANGLIVGGAKHPMDWLSTSPVFQNVEGGTGKHLTRLDVPNANKTVIGNDVWIGSRVIILQGMNIGNGAIIGAGSVVTKDVPDYAIVAGVPAKVIKYRFDDKTIERLMTSKWWTLEDDKIAQFAPFANNVSAVLDIINSFE